MLSIEQFTPWEELEQQVRAVPLLYPRDGIMIYPYTDATITLQEISYDATKPSSLYVLRDNLSAQRKLAEQLAAQGYDPLHLPGHLLLKDESGAEYGLMPPIVEATAADGSYVLDGTHRTYLGWLSGRKTFTAIHISDIREDCPAVAMPNEWADIVKSDAVPRNDADKRHYRVEDYLKLRRNFFELNGSKPRTS